MSAEGNIARFPVDSGDWYRAPSSKISGGIIYIPRARDVLVQLAVFENGLFVEDPSYLSTITVEIRPYTNRAGGALVVVSASGPAALTQGAWDNDTGQHISILLPAAQTAALSSADETNYWMVIFAMTATGKKVTLLSGKVVGVNDGGDYSDVTPTPGNPNFVTQEQLYSIIGFINSGEFVANGWRVRPTVDTDGIVRFPATPA